MFCLFLFEQSNPKHIRCIFNMKVNSMLTIQKSSLEDDILKGCQRRDPRSQKALYERVAPKMLGLCIRYVSDRDEAEHVMIGGLIKVFEKIDQFKGEGSFEGWIRRIIVNECLNYIRKNKQMSLEVEIEQADYQVNYEGLSGILETQDLMKLIEALPIGYRTVFNMYAIEGYNHQEIADQLGISENTSKSQLSRARKYLQQRLHELEEKYIKDIKNGSE